MAAKSAESGGADFLLALNAGRFRSMGAPSAACMLALRDSNRMVMEFGQSEILTQTSLPVFFGATAIGVTDVTRLVRQIVDAGFQGITNFPSCVFLDGQFRQYLEECGHGFDLEMRLLREARAHGLSTLAYAHTVAEAVRAAPNADIVNLDFGWNMGGSVGVESSIDLQQSAAVAAEFVSAVRTLGARTRCVIEGGPIVTPEQMDQVCRSAKADGYIGGSTIDRVPLEGAIEMATSAFKTIGGLRKQVEALETRLRRKVPVDALIGFSESIESAREQVARAVEIDSPVLIVGEIGTGRRDIARVIHEATAPRGRWLISAECDAGAGDFDMDLTLFGAASGAVPGVLKPRPGLLEVARGSTLLLNGVESLAVTVQRQILQAVQMGGFWRRGSTEIIPLDVRFIAVASFDPTTKGDPKRFDPKFLQWLSAVRIDLPAVREHLEDLPMLAEATLRGISKGETHKLSPSAYRVVLGYDWPGNLAELRSVLQVAAERTRGAVITDRDLLRILQPAAMKRSDRKAFSSEREWILDGLRRHRFRRAETAQFLRISRKTLYNKTRKYGLTETGDDSKIASVKRRARPRLTS